jgi:putative ABC transport system permease protein
MLPENKKMATLVTEPTHPLGARRLPSLESFAQDVCYAARTLRGSLAFTLVAVLILALGIGANTAIFSLVSAVLLRPLPFEAAERLVVLWEDVSARGGPAAANPTPASFVDWKARAESFEDMAAMNTVTYNLTGQGEPARLAGIRGTANLFSVLGMQPLLGRTLVPEDDGADAAPVVVINETLWRRRFGADPNFVGEEIVLNGLSHTVVGVVPSDFKFPDANVALWVPASYAPEELAVRNNFYMYVIARLNSATSLSQAQAEMTTIANVLAQEYPDSNAGRGVTVATLHEQIARDTRPMLLILLGAVGLVLLITCANVANLLLARGAGRQRELALRQALGADQKRVLRQLLTESLVLAAAGVVIGIVLSTLSFGYLARLVPGTFPADAVPGLDARVLSFTAGISLLTVLLFGAGPALAAARVGINDVLKQGGGRGILARGGRMRNSLVVAEIALTVVLLAAAGLLLRSYAAVSTVDPGFRPQNLLIAETVLSPSQYAEIANRSAFYDRVLERVNALPGVSSAGYVNYPPLVFKGLRQYVTIEGQSALRPEDSARNITSNRVISADYLATLGVPLIRGRHLDERDAADAPLAVVINEAMARLHWSDRDPIGARIKLGPDDSQSPWVTIVGVVGTVRQMGLDVPAEPEMYLPFTQVPANSPFFWPSHLVVRTESDPMVLSAAVRDVVWDVDTNQPVSSIRSMSQIFDEELASRNTQLTLVGGFAVLALLLASAGLYGVLSYTVAQRAPEIGVRMALGAQRGNVLRSVLRSALLLAVFGVLLGLAASFGLSRVLASFLFGVSPTDPATFVAVPVLLVLVAILASYIPARRAASVDPISALRID